MIGHLDLKKTGSPPPTIVRSAQQSVGPIDRKRDRPDPVFAWVSALFPEKSSTQ